MHPPAYALDASWRTLLTDLGVNPTNVLRRANLPHDLLQQPSVRLPSQDYYRFWDSLEAESGDPLFPIRLCQSIRGESFSPLLFAALCSPNLLVAIQRLARYKILAGPMRLEVTEVLGGVSLKLLWLDAPLVPPASLVLSELLFCVVLARMGTRKPIRPEEVVTPVLPEPTAPYEAIMGSPIRQGTEPRLVFSVADMRRPFLTSNDSLWGIFEPGLRQRMAELDPTASTPQRVRAALLEGLPSGLVSIESVAHKLGLSKRTLQRRIEAEGSSFQQILQQTRHDLAQHYLKNTALSMAEIAFLLGFDEPNSFYRAFRSWSGTTPNGLRQG
jgi:AraC-like DNA-binding protein